MFDVVKLRGQVIYQLQGIFNISKEMLSHTHKHDAVEIISPIQSHMVLCLGAECSHMKSYIIFKLVPSSHQIMNTLVAPLKEELAEDLLAFKHLAIAPECIDDITFKIQLLGLDSEFQKQLYISYRHRKAIHIRKICEANQQLLAWLKLPKPIDSEKWRHKIIEMRSIRKDKLRAQIDQERESLAFDRSQEEKVAGKMGKIEQEILQCVALEVEAFKKVKEKEGKTFKYFDFSEEELRKVAEKRFGKALEAVRFVQQKSKEANP